MASTTRLRKTFAYPTEEEDSEPDDLDETEQEDVITTLRSKDTSSSQFYKQAFLPLPLVAAIVYLPSLLTSRSRADFLLAVLSISSLASTAYVLWYFPPRIPTQPLVRGKTPVYALHYQADGPIEEYLPWLNGVMSALLAMMAGVDYRRGRPEDMWRGLLPGMIFAIVMFARTQMRPLDVAGLERLRYGYKGA